MLAPLGHQLGVQGVQAPSGVTTNMEAATEYSAGSQWKGPKNFDWQLGGGKSSPTLDLTRKDWWCHFNTFLQRQWYSKILQWLAIKLFCPVWLLIIIVSFSTQTKSSPHMCLIQILVCTRYGIFCHSRQASEEILCRKCITFILSILWRDTDVARIAAVSFF